MGNVTRTAARVKGLDNYRILDALTGQKIALRGEWTSVIMGSNVSAYLQHLSDNTYLLL